MSITSGVSAIEYEPAAIGLVSCTADISFGKLHYVAPEVRKHDEAVLFLHGFGSNWTIWTPLIKAAHAQGLLARQDTVLVDLPSFGKSENKLQHLHSIELGHELLTLLRKRGYKRVRVVGHSMGGFLALDLAAHNPTLASAHIVAGSYFTLIRVVNHPMRGLVRAPGITLFYFTQILISRFSWLTKFTNTLYKRVFSRNKKPLYELGGKSFLYASRNGIDYDAPKLWGAINVPLYGAYGGRDKLVSQKDMLELQNIAPGAKLSTVPDAGHSLLISNPKETAKALFSEI